MQEIYVWFFEGICGPLIIDMCTLYLGFQHWHDRLLQKPHVSEVSGPNWLDPKIIAPQEMDATIIVSFWSIELG